jgi:hypothetical protein
LFDAGSWQKVAQHHARRFQPLAKNKLFASILKNYFAIFSAVGAASL